MSDHRLPRIHEDPDLFRSAVIFSAARTRFLPRLIEKDYFCSLLLEHLCPARGALVFKGGTCLAKIHAGFYRLSEDLDFVIPAPCDASRTLRRNLVADLKDLVPRIPDEIAPCRLSKPFTGANHSTQYMAEVSYPSLMNDAEDTIKIEIGLREPLLTPPIIGEARTLLKNPVTDDPFLPTLRTACISREEALAEKFRAALSRRTPAIRDFYDIDHAVRTLGLDPTDSAFKEMVRKKLAIPDNGPIDVSEEKLKALHQQLDAELKPVLHGNDVAAFDLDQAFLWVSSLAKEL